MKTLLKNVFTTTLFVFCVASSFAQSLVVDSQSNTSCAAPNGTASASVDGSTQDYTFRWYAGTDPSGPPLATQPAVTNLQAGVYTVTATHNSTAAVVGPVSVIIQSDITQPFVTVEVLSAKTNCVSPDGSLRAVPDGPAGDYSYAWYYGSSLPLGQGGQTATSLQDGIHTVVVTHNLSQCQTIVSATVPDESTFPTVSVNVLSHLTSCSTPNGAVQAVPGGPATDYNYAWYQGPVAAGAVLSTSQTLSQRPAGAYTVQATHKSATQCTATATINIQDNRSTISASIQVLSHATSCTSPNGSLRAIPSTGSASSYTYKWYAGTLIQGAPISTSQTINNRAPGTYTVLVRHKVSLCETIVSGTIQDNTVTGAIAVQVLAPSTSCISPDGALMVQPQGPSTNYSYAWYEGVMVTGPVLSTGPQAYHLMAGTYTVVVTHNATQCQAIMSATVPDERIVPSLWVNVLSNETSCTAPNGSLAAVVAQGLPEDYSYYWFAGTTAQGPVLSTDAVISQLSAGTYTVVAVHNFSQCESQITAEVLSDIAPLQVSVTVVSDQTSCASSNGALNAEVYGPAFDYTFEWYAGMAYSGPVLSTTPAINGLQTGVYSVVVTHNVSQCLTVMSAAVNDARVMPFTSVQVLSNNTSCADPNGELKALVWPGSAGDYTYSWFEGVPHTVPVLSMSDELEGLDAGTYIVEVTHKVSQCVEWVAQQIIDECQPDLMRTVNEDTGGREVQPSYYPNPVNGTLWINHGGEGKVTISNFAGKVIRSQKLAASDQPFAVDLSDQPAGMYILTFTSGSGTSSHHIMKQ